MGIAHNTKEFAKAWKTQFSRARKLRKSGLIPRYPRHSRLIMPVPREIRPPGSDLTKKSSKNADALEHQELPSRNSLLDLPLEIRYLFYSYLLPSLGLTTVDLLRLIQNNEHRTRFPSYTSLSVTCRQIYFELQPLLSAIRIFPLTPFITHCLAHKHYRTRNGAADPLLFNHLSMVKRYEYYDRDGNIWNPNPEGYTPSIHRAVTVEKHYELLPRCGPCRGPGTSLLQLHATQLARAVHRVVVPCCLCSAYIAPDGLWVLGQKIGKWIDWARVGSEAGLDPRELVFVCCTCKGRPLTGYSYGLVYNRMQDFGFHLAEMAERFVSLRKVVVYYCRDEDGERERVANGNTMGQPITVDFPEEIAVGKRSVSTGPPLWMSVRERFDNPDARWVRVEGSATGELRQGDEASGPQAVYYGKTRPEGKRKDISKVRLEFYDSDTVSRKACVFGGVPLVTL